MFNKIFKGIKENEINLLCKEYSSGDYIEDRDYIAFLIANRWE